MTDHKFTDEEVRKALECCTSSTTSEACNGCPFSETDICEKMSNALEIYALDLINRQKAKIERLYKEIGRISKMTVETNVKEMTEEKNR